MTAQEKKVWLLNVLETNKIKARKLDEKLFLQSNYADSCEKTADNAYDALCAVYKAGAADPGIDVIKDVKKVAEIWGGLVYEKAAGDVPKNEKILTEIKTKYDEINQKHEVINRVNAGGSKMKKTTITETCQEVVLKFLTETIEGVQIMKSSARNVTSLDGFRKEDYETYLSVLKEARDSVGSVLDTVSPDANSIAKKILGYADDAGNCLSASGLLGWRAMQKNALTATRIDLGEIKRLCDVWKAQSKIPFAVVNAKEIVSYDKQKDAFSVFVADEIFNVNDRVKHFYELAKGCYQEKKDAIRVSDDKINEYKREETQLLSEAAAAKQGYTNFGIPSRAEYEQILKNTLSKKEELKLEIAKANEDRRIDSMIFNSVKTYYTIAEAVNKWWDRLKHNPDQKTIKDAFYQLPFQKLREMMEGGRFDNEAIKEFSIAVKAANEYIIANTVGETAKQLWDIASTVELPEEFRTKNETVEESSMEELEKLLGISQPTDPEKTAETEQTQTRADAQSIDENW